MKLTQERLKEVLAYDPETGGFIRLKGWGNGKAANCLRPDGYIHIKIDSKRYLAHRLAWLYTRGYFPEHQVDHLNGVRDDNRMCNLREVSSMCNLQNTKIRNTNKSGFPGVTWNKQCKKWCAYVSLRSQRIHLGHHPMKLEAALARLTWEVNCPSWSCNNRGELVKAIKKEWPEFNERSLV